MASPVHLIIAERDATVRTMLERLLTSLYPSASISALADGGEALACHAARGADLLITSQRLSSMSGLELVRALRAEQPTLPILMYSADKGLKAAALSAGATAFVAKLGRLDELRGMLTDLLPPTGG